ELDSPALQGVGDPLCAVVDLAVGGAHDRPFDRAGDDFTMTVPSPGVVEDLVDRKRPVLHQPQHAPILLRLLGRALSRTLKPKLSSGKAAPGPGEPGSAIAAAPAECLGTRRRRPDARCRQSRPRRIFDPENWPEMRRDFPVATLACN